MTYQRIHKILIAISVFAMMMITVVDVFGRYILNTPLRGASELVGLLLAAMVMLGLPSVSARREHIAVGALEGILPSRARQWLRHAIELLCAVVAVLIVVALAFRTRQVFGTGEHSLILRIALWPTAAALTVLWGVVAGVHFRAVLRGRIAATEQILV